ncbi:MAG: hypothetical protein K6L81_08685 [Agarilytica sp.]
MKTDVLTLAAIVFVAGLLLSSITASDIFENNEDLSTSVQQANVSR